MDAARAGPIGRRDETQEGNATSAESRVDAGFTITRVFQAPPERVWHMWTTPAAIQQWWGGGVAQMGYAFPVEAMDARPGEGFAFRITGHGDDVVNRGTYRVVEAPRRLAWTWHYDLYLAPGEEPYDVPIEVRLARTTTGGTQLTFTQGPLAQREQTLAAHEGVLTILEHLARLLDGGAGR